MLGKIKEQLLEMIFPSYCAYCGRIGSFLCERCQAKIIKIKDDSCPGCNTISKRGRFCTRCRKKSFLVGVFSVGYFKDEVLKETIHEFKYERVSGLAPILGALLSEKVRSENISVDYAFYVPISRKREAWRGFNQSELLANEVGRELGVPLGVLKKTKETKTQVGLPKKEREKNLANAFSVVAPKKLCGKMILLIDDVFTTGTTLNECAKALKQNGAKVVYGAVLAKE